MTELALGDARLFLADRTAGSDALAQHALATASGTAPRSWRIVRRPSGQPIASHVADRGRPISISAAGDVRGVVIARSGPIGLDIETAARIALNTGPDDNWLHVQERRLLASLSPPERLLEIGCRWVVREAAGKAIGLGLAAWPAAPTIDARDGAIVIPGWSGWRFGLSRWHDLLIATAHAPGGGSGHHAVDARGKEPPDHAGGEGKRAQHL